MRILCGGRRRSAIGDIADLLRVSTDAHADGRSETRVMWKPYAKRGAAVLLAATFLSTAAEPARRGVRGALSGFAQALGDRPDAALPGNQNDQDMNRNFLFVSSFNPAAARRAAMDSPLPIDLAVISPTEAARETAGFAVGGRWVFIIEEPLFAARAFAESGSDVLARVAQAMRDLAAYDVRAPLAVLDGLDLLGAGAFSLDEAGLLRAADDLERLLPQP
jgi:hypothetical protein